jgi:ABC-type transporter Mla maintaining outer membrane lipid asymmetry ATPase subunit MlaF
MRRLPHGVRNDIPMTFMILRDGKAIFDGDIEELIATKDDYIREYIS